MLIFFYLVLLLCHDFEFKNVADNDWSNDLVEEEFKETCELRLKYAFIDRC